MGMISTTPMINNQTIRRPQGFLLSSLVVFALNGLLIVGCGGPQPASEPPPGQSIEKPPMEPDEQAAQDPRILTDKTNFGNLVDVVNLLDQHTAHHSETNCFLRKLDTEKPSWRIEADLAVAVRPLPKALNDLSAKLQEEPKPIHVMTRWGRIGEHTDGFVLVAFTTTTPASAKLPAVALFVTAAGVYVRQSEAVLEIQAEPLKLSDIGPFLAKATAQKEFILFITADEALPLGQLHELLFMLPYPKPEVALATVLGPDTRLPQPPKVDDESKKHWCPSGLPELPESEGEGNLPPTEIKASLGPLLEGSQKCLASAVGPSASGGQVLIAFRIGKSGKVESQCLVQDEIKDAALASCLLEAAGDLTFTPPSPSGFVDVHLPLRLTPMGIDQQRPICN